MTFPDFPRPELPRPVPPIHGELSPDDDGGEDGCEVRSGCAVVGPCDGVCVAVEDGIVVVIFSEVCNPSSVVIC